MLSLEGKREERKLAESTRAVVLRRQKGDWPRSFLVGHVAAAARIGGERERTAVVATFTITVSRVGLVAAGDARCRALLAATAGPLAAALWEILRSRDAAVVERLSREGVERRDGNHEGPRRETPHEGGLLGLPGSPSVRVQHLVAYCNMGFCRRQ